ncbi:MAG: hypothetical protein AAF490_03950 [Chloroflexota bacterium]
MEEIEKTLTAARHAMGVKNDSLQIDSIDTLAKCTGPAGQFSTRIYSAIDGRMSMIQAGSTGRRLLAGIDTETSWFFNAETHSFASLPLSSQAFLRGHELHMLALAPQTRLESPEWLGDSHFTKQPAWTIRFKDSLESPLDIHYSQESGLPLGLSQMNHTGRGAETVEVVFSNWHMQPSGIQLFTQSDFIQGDDVYKYEFVYLNIDSVSDILLQSPEQSDEGVDAALLRHLHEQHQMAHLTYDAGLFTSAFHDPILQANRGEIQQSSREESQKRSQAYFDQVEFIAWEDLESPVIRVSKEGTMASILVHKRVHLTAAGSAGEAQEHETVFAWLESWEKIEGNWQLMMIASTNR